MSDRTRVGIPVARDSPDLEINADGSIDVRQRISDALAQTPVRTIVGLTPVLIVAENENRRDVDVFNHSDVIIYLGFDDTVGVLTGMPLVPYTGVIYDEYHGEVWAISTVVGTDVRVLEMEDDVE